MNPTEIINALAAIIFIIILLWLAWANIKDRKKEGENGLPGD